MITLHHISQHDNNIKYQKNDEKINLPNRKTITVFQYLFAYQKITILQHYLANRGHGINITRLPKVLSELPCLLENMIGKTQCNRQHFNNVILNVIKYTNTVTRQHNIPDT